MIIGNVEIKGFAGLAPMAGVTDRAFRQICREHGCSYFISEMASSKALTMQAKKTSEILRINEKERPIALQLFGDDPMVMAEAAIKAMEFSPDIIDINMGCPAPKIASNGGGAALMKDIKLAAEILSAVKKAVSVPVTAKIRKGWDEASVNATEMAKALEAAGADAICVHGRTRTQMYAGEADWDIIAKVKALVSVPVIANGDVTNVYTAKAIYEQTGADYIMIGRAACGAPWLFEQINAFMQGQEIKEPSLQEKMEIMTKHIGLLCENKGEHIGMKEARKHCSWYMRGLHGAAAYRREFSQMAVFPDMERIVEQILHDYAKTEQEV